MPSPHRVASRWLRAGYEPEPDAPPRGEWDRSGDEPRWSQDHRELVVAALNSWKGDPIEMTTHIGDERVNAPQPGNGTGKQWRAQAAALLYELKHNSRKSGRPLYRGSHVEPRGEQSWTTWLRTAQLWAGKNHGRVFELPAGTRGLRVKDYLVGDDPEREWIVQT